MPKYQNRPSVRHAVSTRAANRCEYSLCPDDISPAPFEVEHIQPSSESGSDSPDNFAWSCPHCNGAKGATMSAIDPESKAMTALFNPRTQVWQEHFRWHKSDNVLIEGITDTGRATVVRPQLNRAPFINLR